MGRDLMRELKLKIDFETDELEYGELKLPMRDPQNKEL
jgi:hypothetical protein